MRYTLSDIAELTGGVLHGDSKRDRLFNYVNSDSRLINKADTLFAALKGDSFDGHRFAAALCENGGALVDDPNYFCPNSVLVPSVKAALYRLAQHWRNNSIKQLKVLAITGSVGKTTAKNMAYLAMKPSFNCYKTVGNRNSLTGLPMEILNISEDHTHAVLEAGMSDPGEIGQISRLIKPTSAVITNVGHSHIMAFGSREGICEEKLSITDGMEELCITVPDEPMLVSRLNGAEGAVVCSLTDKGREAYADEIKETAEGMEFTLCYGGKRLGVALPAYGRHNVMNAMLVLVSAIRMGADGEKAASSLLSFAPEGNRQKIRELRNIKVIADCYNASPESMAAALGVLGSSGGKRIAVLGDMLELGEHSKALHRQVGARVPKGADTLICVGGEAAYIADSAIENGMDKSCVFVYPSEDYDKAAELLIGIAEAGDTVLFKASNRTNIKKVMEKFEL